jgi:ubiquinone/menaquinone biosynthesis C-methylase UbiE
MSKYYQFENYDYFDRWSSYWHQINEVLKSRPKSVLEIGVGNRMVSSYLKRRGLNIKTLDISKERQPDFTGSVEEMSFGDNFFDLILCAEVLEHLPFDKFEKCLKELRRVSKKDVILTLPHFGPPIKLSLKIPFLKEVRIAFKIPYHPEHKSKVHYWEIDKRGYRLKKIRKTISKYFTIKNEFIPFENQYHHFFILEK